MKRNSDIIKFDNALSPTLYQYIKGYLVSPEFPWCYVENTAYANVTEHNNPPSFSQLIYHENKRMMDASQMIEAGLMCLLDRFELRIKELIRIRVGLLTKTDTLKINHPHVDYKQPHMTALMYLSNSDAPTVFYKNFYDPKSDKETYAYMVEKFGNKMKVEEEIPCIENTGVIFNGHRYHSSSIPTNCNRRIVINCNFTVY